MRKITKPEIENLYAFTRKHYVEYYDLQTELVDHLANGMEARWQENPHLSFEENLNLEFKKFGVFGFSDVVEKRQRAMEKKYYRLIWKELLSAFCDPKILFFILLFSGICIFLQQSETGALLLSVGVLLLATVGMVRLFKLQFSYQKKTKRQEKKYLLEEMIANTGGIHTLLMLPLYWLNIFPGTEFSQKGIYSALLTAIFISIVILLAYICFRILPKKKKEILKKAYPQWEIME